MSYDEEGGMFAYNKCQSACQNQSIFHNFKAFKYNVFVNMANGICGLQVIENINDRFHNPDMYRH